MGVVYYTGLNIKNYSVLVLYLFSSAHCILE